MKDAATKILKNKKFWTLSFLLLLLWIFSLWKFLSFSDKNYVGDIVEISSGSLVVDDGKIGNIEIFFNESTPILSRQETKNLSISTPVFVRAIKDEKWKLSAEFIRILKPKNNEKK